jgi:hypothetical protein
MHAGRATGRAVMTGGGSGCGPAAGSVTVDLASSPGAVLVRESFLAPMLAGILSGTIRRMGIRHGLGARYESRTSGTCPSLPLGL